MNLNFLKAQKPSATPIEDQEKVKSQYKYWRIRIMYSSFIGYAVYYFCRKNLSAATPGIIQDLHLTKTEIGWIWSLLYLTYGLSKLINGMIGDRSNARYFMAIGLLLSAATNVLFGMGWGLTTLGVIWALNGWFQGMGWPASARVLTQWYSSNERGTTWAIWNTSHQVGGGLILILGGYLTQHYGWKYAFFVPSVIGVVCAVYLINRLRDTPESIGLPAIEDYRNDRTAKVEKIDGAHPIRDILVKQVLLNRPLWFLALANFFVYLVRYGAMDWAPTYLVEVKHSSIANAATKTALFEFIGIAGAMLAGWLADHWFQGKRGWVNFIYMVVLAFAVVEFWLIPPGHPVLDSLALSAVGFLVYGPQMLVGVCAADLAAKDAAATATGFTGLWGYIGSIASGAGTGWVVDHYGWNGGFVLFTISAVLGALLFLATVESRHQKNQTNGISKKSVA